MTHTFAEPVGFSDLTEDEGFLIIIFRDWLRRGPTRAIAEHAIARVLRGDRFYPILNAVFSTFGRVADAHDDCWEDGIVLTDAEETLLTQISEQLDGLPASAAVPPDIRIRPAAEIERSGHDRLLGACDRAYWQMAMLQAVGRKRPH